MNVSTPCHGHGEDTTEESTSLNASIEGGLIKIGGVFIVPEQALTPQQWAEIELELMIQEHDPTADLVFEENGELPF